MSAVGIPLGSKSVNDPLGVVLSERRTEGVGPAAPVLVDDVEETDARDEDVVVVLSEPLGDEDL